MRLLSTLIVCVLVYSCAHSPGPNPASQSGGAVINVQNFDAFLHNQLPPEKIAEMRQECGAKESISPFCVSVNRFESLEKFLKRKFRDQTYIAQNKEKAPPIPITFKNGKFQDLKKLQKHEPKDLVGSFETTPLADLKQMAAAVLKEKKCPNNLAVALSARLEDYLPEAVSAKEVSRLYEKGAACAKKDPEDREHFYTRAGLLRFLGKDYKEASKLFAKASKANPDSARASYWHYRSEKELGHKAAADKIFKRLENRYPLSFHTMMAEYESSQDPSGGWLAKDASLKTAPRSKRVEAINPLIEQAEMLNSLGYESSASLIAEWALTQANRAEYSVRLYLATLADGKTRIAYASDIITQKPKTIDKGVLQLYFPKLYLPIFEKHSGSLDPYILMAIARQESIFDPRAVSGADARGLMQIHPETGARLSRSGSAPDLFDPNENIYIGARYMEELLKRYNGKIHLVLAAYNAGEDKLDVWVKRYPGEDPLLFVDLISYRETRNYVASVLRNYFWYRRLNTPGGVEFVKGLMSPDVARK